MCITCTDFKRQTRSDRGIGAFTRIDTTGTSVVDYMVGSPQLFAVTSNFHIHGKFAESDHAHYQSLLIPNGIKMNLATRLPMLIRGLNIVNINGRCLILKNLKGPWLTISLPCHEIAPWRLSYIYMRTSNEIAVGLTEYIMQAADRAFEKQVAKPSKTRKCPGWYDKECRQLRGEAVKAGERAASGDDVRNLLQKSRA